MATSVQGLTGDEDTAFKRMLNDQHKLRPMDIKHERYYDGDQRLEHIGLAVPPELRRFETVLNVPAMAVDEVERRLDVKSLMLPGEDQANKDLRELWDANNLDSEASMLHRDVLMYGRGFVTVGTPADDDTYPYLRVESARSMHMLIDDWRRRTDAALRLYQDQTSRNGKATLYMPNATIWLERENGGKWKVVERGEHTLGRVPVLMFLNNRKTGTWTGRTEMKSVMGMTDSIARTLTNMALAGETHAVPPRYVIGAKPTDFVDKKGNPLPKWEAYMNAFMATADAQVKIGQLNATDMKNFHDTVNNLLSWCAATTGLPTRYMGQHTANPATEGAINADEARLIKNVERKQTTFGDVWGWALALGYEIWRGQPIEGNRVKIEWHDASTPTFAQKADAISKMTGGKPVFSREGAWDELGWSDARKSREKEYFRQEAREEISLYEKAVNDV